MRKILKHSSAFICLFAISAISTLSAENAQCYGNSCSLPTNQTRPSDQMNQGYGERNQMNQADRNYNQGYYSSDRMNQSSQARMNEINQGYRERNQMNQADRNYNQGYYSADRMNHSGKDTVVMTDEELAAKIHDKIGSGLFTKGYDHVVVHVDSGVVTLSGSVNTQEDKDKVEKEVRNIEGVKSLNSNITIQNDSKYKSDDKFKSDSFATPADEQLNKKIRDNVSRGWLWDSYKDIRLNTTNGAVTIEGAVDSLKDQQKLIDEIQKVEGVKSVKSNLRIIK